MATRGSRQATEEGTTAAIYGVIVSAAVMASSHAESGIKVDLAVLVTLVIYWAAERYARLMAQRIHAGHKPTGEQVRHELASGWEMVTASALPLAVLAVLSVLGVGLQPAVIAALCCSTVLLGLGGWEMGRGGRLSTPERLVSTGVAGAFGVVMIVLKSLLH